MMVWLALLTMMNPQAACKSIHGERILGSDLARALPALSGIPSDASIAYSPAPGKIRAFTNPELQRIGKRYGISVPADSQTCFAWQTQRLTPDQVRRSILETLKTPQARVEILSMSQAAAPEGKLEFPLTGLSISSSADPATPVMWRGQVVFGSGRKFDVWARVRVSATTTRVVALVPLMPGKLVERKQVRVETYDDFPLHSGIARDIEEVIGRTPRRAIAANAPILRADLIEPFEIRRGETVAVTVISGAAEVALNALAESSGRQGDFVTLTNPRSGRRFRARVEGKDRALLIAGGAGTGMIQ